MALPSFHAHRRATETIRILSKHGFAWLLEEAGIVPGQMLHRLDPRRKEDIDHISQPERLRMALEELGTTYIKLGQMLSTRDDLLPPAYISELSRLRSHVQPVDSNEIVEEIEAELGGSIDEFFSCFEYEPLASASIGQVHAATLRNGTAVVVKVQKPGVAIQVNEDLILMRQVASWADRHGHFSEQADAVTLVDEFAWTIRNELDYLQEGRNADRFRESFSGNSTIRIPFVYWELTTPRVITYERLDGITITDVEELDAAGIDRKALALRASRIILDEIFDHGFYHADPHPGNFVIAPDGTVIAYDFGMVGTVSRDTRRNLLQLIPAIASRDIDRVLDALTALRIVDLDADRRTLGRDVERMIDRYYGLSLDEYQFDAIVSDIMSVIRHHQMRVPGELNLLIKTLVMHEGTARILDPEFSVVAVAEPYARKAILDRYRPDKVFADLIHTAEDMSDLMRDGPRVVTRLLRRADEGEFAVRIDSFDVFLDRASQLVNRLIIGWLIGASAIALAILLAVARPEIIFYRGGVLIWVGVIVTAIALLILAFRLRRF